MQFKSYNNRNTDNNNNMKKTTTKQGREREYMCICDIFLFLLTDQIN